jgi:type I restriction enzyme S subunit
MKVEWKKLGEVCKTITPPKKLEKELYGVNGAFPIIDQGQKDIVGYTNDETSLVPNDEYILFGDHTRYVKYFNGSFAQGADGLKILKAANGILPRYFFFSFENVDVPSRGYSRHWSIAKELIIPIPSLEEQTRIVGILDTFTYAIDNLKEQIAQRRKQYEYYRDQLLDLEGKPGVEMKTLGELCEIKGRIGFRGYTREDQVEKGEGAISLSPGNIINGIIDYNSCTYITWEKYEESPEIMTLDGDIILCKTASVGKVAMVMNLPEKATINPQLVVLKNIKIANKYLYYQLSTFKIQAILKGLAGIGSVPNISQAKLADIKICISSTDEQQRIVSILDTFEASIQNLEAQLEQRQKQYEYYRNKLLNFE